MFGYSVIHKQHLTILLNFRSFKLYYPS